MRRPLFAAAALILLTAGLAACGAASKPKLTATIIEVSISHCGQGWTHPTAGQQSLQLRNTDTRAGEVYLTDATSGAVYAEVDNLGPGASADMAAYLDAGHYTFRCAMEDEDVVVGPTVVISGSVAAGMAPVAAVTQGELIEATKNYESYVNAALPGLIAQTQKLAADLATGELATARADWLPAHLSYERLGAAYDAFGDADGEINGTTAGLPDGLGDSDFTGFHRIEYGLWNGQLAAELAPSGQALIEAVTGLADSFPTTQVDPLAISLRAHEIVENALQFELTAQTDYGSHTNLATVRANLDGTQELITVLQPLLTSRYTDEQKMTTQLQKTMTDLDPLLADNVQTLPLAKREQINADVSELAELLAPVASILEPRRVQ